jgi:hypothetical protein
MKKLLLAILTLGLGTLAQAQPTTQTFRAIAPIAQYQCVAVIQIRGHGGVVPCDNTGTDYFNGVIPPAVGVALTASAPCNHFDSCGTVTVQTSGFLTVPGASWTIGAFLGDEDGTGDLQSMGFALTTLFGPQSYAGFSTDSETIYVQPGYVPGAN